mmetsp:Transcript_4898/g.18171  ORF Transcript_4898/g.18171 Transcript_4898/m.18171 type:complete len:221 (+) Transcript_4898:3098-3760(+)
MPIAHRLRSPPLIPRITSLPTFVSAAATSPKSAMTSSTNSFFRVIEISGPRRNCAANIRVSRTVESANKASSCSTYALSLAITPGDSTHFPSANTSPVISAPGPRGTRNARALSNDVFPLPLGPISASKEPPRASPLRCDKIVFTAWFVSEDVAVACLTASLFVSEDVAFFVTVYVRSRHCRCTPAPASPGATSGDIVDKDTWATETLGAIDVTALRRTE